MPCTRDRRLREAKGLVQGPAVTCGDVASNPADVDDRARAPSLSATLKSSFTKQLCSLEPDRLGVKACPCCVTRDKLFNPTTQLLSLTWGEPSRQRHGINNAKTYKLLNKLLGYVISSAQEVSANFMVTIVSTIDNRHSTPGVLNSQVIGALDAAGHAAKRRLSPRGREAASGVERATDVGKRERVAWGLSP